MSASHTELLVFDPKLIKEQEYWVQKVSAHSWSHSIARDDNDSSVVPARKSRVTVTIHAPIYQSIQSLTGPSDFLTYTLLVASLKLCLARYSLLSVIVVGSPALKHGRPNVLAIIDHIDPDMAVKQWLINVRGTLLEAYERQQYPFSYLLRSLGKSAEDTPVFNVVVGFSALHGELPPLNTDLAILFDKHEGTLVGHFDFNSAVLELATVERLANHLLKTIKEIAANPDLKLADIDIQTEEEKQRAIIEWNDTGVDLAESFSVCEAFVQQASRTPDAIAVEYENEQLSYATLDQKSSQLASRLRGLGAGPDVPIGIFIERSPLMIVGILGILKASAAYLPLDLTHPKRRLALMLSDMECPIVITVKHLVASLPDTDAHIICLDADPNELFNEDISRGATAVEPDSLAYVIYTSGSTGTPKGVMISHSSLANYLMWAIRTYSTESDFNSIIHTPIGFDLTVTSLFPSLLQGGRVMPLPEHAAIDDLADTLSRVNSFGVLKLTPAHLAILDRLVAPEEISKWRGSLVIGGENLLTEYLRNLLAHSTSTRIFNEYGPTEATVGCCFHDLERNQSVKGAVPIGRPIANAHMLLLDPQLRSVPVGVRGEIFIGGAGLARGYSKRPDLTAERFIPNPFAAIPGQRLYRTGDLARYRPNGTIEYLGRMDQQVKIRSYRVELGEIEKILLQYHPGIADAAVVVREASNGEKSLVAFVCTSYLEIDEPDLRAFISNRLPEYMVPSSVVILPELPTRVNGKVDRNALAQMDPFLARQRTLLIGPRNPIEQVLHEIWQELLETVEISVNDSFFELGGHSLFATQVVSRIRKRLQVDLPLRCLFEFPTIAGLGSVIAAKLQEEGPADRTGVTIVRQERGNIGRTIGDAGELTDRDVEALLEAATRGSGGGA